MLAEEARRFLAKVPVTGGAHGEGDPALLTLPTVFESCHVEQVRWEAFRTALQHFIELVSSKKVTLSLTANLEALRSIAS